MKLKVNKGATVEVITGSEKGKRGEVLAVNRQTMRVRVQGVKIVTHHSKKDGLLKSEGYIHYSNVKLIDAPAKKTEKKSEKKTEKKSSKAKGA